MNYKNYILPLVVVGVVIGSVLVGILLSSKKEVVGTVIGDSIQASDNQTGNQQATIELVEYADFQCPACASYDPMVKKLLEEHKDWIRFAYRHFPLKAIHPNAVSAAQASEAAGLQGKFFEFKEVLYTKQSEWSKSGDPTPRFMEYARELGLDEERFTRDMRSEEVAVKVESQYQTAVALGLNSTPSFLLNRKKIANPQTYEQFVELLRNEVK